MSLVYILWHVMDGNHHTSAFSTSEGAEVSLAYRKTWFIGWMIFCGSNYESEEKHFTLVCSFRFLLLCRNSWITNKVVWMQCLSPNAIETQWSIRSHKHTQTERLFSFTRLVAPERHFGSAHFGALAPPNLQLWCPQRQCMLYPKSSKCVHSTAIIK